MKMLTKRSIIGLVLISIVLFSSSAYAIPVSRLELSATMINPGDTFLLDVFVDGVILDEAIAFGFDVIVNSSEFTFNGAAVGADFDDASSSIPATDVAGIVFPGPGPSGDNIHLASLSFTSLIAGNYSVGIISDLLDKNEGLITWLDTYDISNSIQVNPVPEPATILLLVTGMAGFGVFGRKKFRKRR